MKDIKDKIVDAIAVLADHDCATCQHRETCKKEGDACGGEYENWSLANDALAKIADNVLTLVKES